MVFKTRASDLDSFDRRLPRRHLLPPVALANQLPVNPAGKIQLPESDLVMRWPSEALPAPWITLLSESNLHFLCINRNPERRRRFACRRAPNLRKKINVKRVNC
jgi:hypothetical protein